MWLEHSEQAGEVRSKETQAGPDRVSGFYFNSTWKVFQPGTSTTQFTLQTALWLPPGLRGQGGGGGGEAQSPFGG